ncbi:Modifier of mdg4 [Operophtera brumata]|uniref:Modifier of mdg4 n=1 Tax=Operophtera brumata TaxID=104452 RepID=A0A0L7LBH9_OPEBR|nr:Modifier of mdg4 [Operophtera brumata]
MLPRHSTYSRGYDDHFKFTTSQKGRPMILASGYKFGIHRVRSPKTYWYCHNASQGCHAIIHTLADMTIIKCYNI